MTRFHHRPEHPATPTARIVRSAAAARWGPPPRGRS
ncbi:hypothetical protein J2Z33_000868 [Rubellimicrobium aerolatum]|nr:hypothetical protein [Rubellimicrobium aerolatum]